MTRKIKQIYNNIKIWNEFQEYLTKSRENFLSCTKEKVRKKLIKNNRSSPERLNITNDPLLSILTSLETEATTENNDATEEPVEADFLE